MGIILLRKEAPMPYLIYANDFSDFKGGNLSQEKVKSIFQGAIQIWENASQAKLRMAFLFIDPLINSFEAANHFYFNTLGLSEASPLNTYKSGNSPMQAMHDAKIILENDLVDLCFIFGYEPLASLKNDLGKEKLAQAMDIYQGTSLPQAYNSLAHRLLEILEINKNDFYDISDALYKNYKETFEAKTGQKQKAPDRPKKYEAIGADLFSLTDMSNPYVDYTGGIILANQKAVKKLELEPKLSLAAASYKVVADGPSYVYTIAGQEAIYPHLREVFKDIEEQAGICPAKEHQNSNLLLEAYTCYPPSPMGFLMAGDFVKEPGDFVNFLQSHPITVSGGMNFARGPWNNPALHGLVEMVRALSKSPASYGLVHGNGGLGGYQGLSLLKKI